jgi:hypothetical protein
MAPGIPEGQYLVRRMLLRPHLDRQGPEALKRPSCASFRRQTQSYRSWSHPLVITLRDRAARRRTRRPGVGTSASPGGDQVLPSCIKGSERWVLRHRSIASPESRTLRRGASPPRTDGEVTNLHPILSRRTRARRPPSRLGSCRHVPRARLNMLVVRLSD